MLIATERDPSPDYPGNDVHITNLSQGSSGYIEVERENNTNAILRESAQISNLSQGTSGYLHFDRAINNGRFQRSIHDTGGQFYDNNVNGPHQYTQILPDERRILTPAIVSNPRVPTGNGNIFNNSRLRVSNQSGHTYISADIESQQNENGLKRNGTKETIIKFFRIIITTITIAGVALVLTLLLTNNQHIQSEIGKLNSNIPTQIESLKSDQIKDNNNTLTKYTENQRQVIDKTSQLLNITELNLEANSNLTENILSLSNKTKIAFQEIGDMMNAISNGTNSSILEIRNIMESSLTQFQNSSKPIANNMEALSHHTKTSSKDLKNIFKEKSNQTQTSIIEIGNMVRASFSHLQNSSKDVANNMIALFNHTEKSSSDLKHVFKQQSNQTQTSINEIGNMVEASLSQLQNSSNDISHNLRALSDHTNTSLIDVKDMLKDQSNEIKSLLGDMIKDVLKELKNELKTVIQSSIGGGCVNNSLNVTTGECVDSCLRVADGDYQSCDTCHGYVTCANNYIYQRNCSTDHLEWDDNKKQCVWQSETCQ